MSVLNFSDNIVRLRHDKQITQGELADFIGVTKASVSKWETKQSMPDIVLLPQLASFFDVTVDELLGYEPVLSKEQIQKVYYDLTASFSREPFDSVFDASVKMSKQYYSCYSFLLQMCVLWLNHFMLAKTAERQQEVLEKASDVCTHIIEDCRDIGICNDAIQLKASVDLVRGKAAEVVETLEETQNPYRLSNQGDGNLIRAYQMAGQMDKANEFAQISMFSHLLMLVTAATQYISIHITDKKVCEETIRRVNKLVEVYQLNALHPNSVAVYRYQVSCYYCGIGEKKKALEYIRQYAASLDTIFEGGEELLHGDEYFDLLKQWFDNLDLGARAPRDKKIVVEGALQSLLVPTFAVLEEEEEFQKIILQLRERIAGLEDDYESN